MDKEVLLSISRPQKLCMNCNAPLDTIARHPSVLRLAAHAAERADYCPECWQLLKDEAYDSFWITRRVPRERPRLNRRQRSAALRALFESLWERREEENVGPHLYLLAHLLMKWGGLRWKENQTDTQGREVVVFEDPASGDRIEVTSASADEERMAAIQREIEDFLREYAPETQADNE
jgi:hypothetical protein